jgi:NADPH:quinone reductase-like Zn-dependent oxidoreductase
MKAIVYKKYGPPDVLQIEEVEKPAPDENQVLVKVHAASNNAGDYRSMNPDAFLIRLMSGLLKPKNPRLGWDLAERVEAVGKNIKQFRPGDEVFGCSNGTFAEYVLAKEDRLVLKPANKSFEEAAALPVAALTALQGLRDAADVRPGQKVLIYGASGGVGTFAVQFAKSFGAEVTAVCSTKIWIWCAPLGRITSSIIPKKISLKARRVTT